jgi:hypothetical protein
MKIVSFDIRIACDHCEAVGMLAPKFVNRLIQCSNCRKTFRATADRSGIAAAKESPRKPQTADELLSSMPPEARAHYGDALHWDPILRAAVMQIWEVRNRERVVFAAAPVYVSMVNDLPLEPPKPAGLMAPLRKLLGGGKNV